MEEKNAILEETGKIFDPRHFLAVNFLSDHYKIDSDDFLLFIISVSILLEEGHIRINIESMEEDLEKYFLLNLKSPSFLTDRMLENCKKSHSIIEKYPEVFGGSLFRTPFVILDSGKSITSEKLYFLEKKVVDLIIKYAEKSFKPPQLMKTLSEAEAIVALIEGRDSITLEMKQKEAVVKALTLPFILLTGGPGTGKTTTVISMVKAIIEGAEKGGRNISVALCAPTGRAANRIEEMVRGEGLEGLIEKPQTLHRLLKISGGKSLYPEGRFLPYDAVIVDESSMIDLKMMKNLFSSLSPDTTLVLAGDADQLPSVEAGAVFSDLLADSKEEGHLLNKSVVVLDKMKRSASELTDFSVRIRENRISFNDPDSFGSSIVLKPLDEKTIYRDLASVYLPAHSAESVFDIIGKNGILTATNKGQFGMDSINNSMKEIAGYRNLQFYENMPLMVLKNDYINMVFNGDRGVIVKKDEIFTAAFRTGQGEIRYIPVSMLKEWTPSYAQTVHKSQGSEFDNVYLILDSFSGRILTREILYTAVTRAKKKITIYSDEDTLETAVSRKILRKSGIRQSMAGRPGQ